MFIQVWFQNQRAKVKKNQKKARQENKSCSETESLGESSLENETKIKDENESKSIVAVLILIGNFIHPFIV